MEDDSADKPDHNPIFDKLVGQDVTDPSKLVAYALYKRHKRDFFLGLRKEGREPTDAIIDTFTKSALANLESYTNEARSAMDAYVYSVVDDERPNIEKEAITGRIENAVARLEGRGTLLRDFVVGIFVWIISLVILFLIWWGATQFGVDVLDVLPNRTST